MCLVRNVILVHSESNHLGKFWLFQGFVLSVVPKIYFLIMLCNSFNKILVNVRYTPYHLHQIELQAEADAEESEYDIDCLVENFSLQILHQPIQFTAMGFFSINFQQLREVRIQLACRYIHVFGLLNDPSFQFLASCTTYIVIFIQLTPRYNV